MFFDERINLECGKIYKRGITFAMLVTVLYGTFRSLPFIAAKEYRCIFSVLETVIVLCGIIILTVDLIKFKGQRDERAVFERHRYYLKAIKVFLIITLAAYVVAIPTIPKSSFTTISPNHLLLILQVLGYVYMFYSFKSRDINFNYSFIAEDKKTYYSRVFKNIGLLWGILFVAFCFSATLDLMLHKSVLNFISILRGYLLSAAGAAIEYLFVSFIEKVSYDDEGGRLKKGTIIAGSVYLLFYISHSILNMICVMISTADHSNIEGNVGEILAYFTTQRLYMGYVLTILSAITLCHLLTQIKRSRASKSIISVMLSLSAASVIIQFIQSFIFAVMHNEDAVIYFITAANYLTYGMKALSLFSVFALAAVLYKKLNISRVVLIIPIAYTAAEILSLFLNSQHTYILSAATNHLICLSASVFAIIILCRSDYKDENE